MSDAADPYACISLRWCRKCRAFHAPGKHLPTFEVVAEWPNEDVDWDDARTVRAANVEQAARRWAKSEDDFYEGDADVCVRDSSGAITRIGITAELSTVWRTMIKPETAEVGQ